MNVDGTKVDYAFNFRVYSRASTSYQYASASLSAAVYREGEITLDGKKRRLVVVDFNSNGRFDDEFAVDEKVRLSSGAAYARSGDIIFIDPKASTQGTRYSYDVTSSDDKHHVSKFVRIDGGFYNLKVSPAGDEVTLTAHSGGIGQIKNPNTGYRALVYGDGGFLKIHGDKSGQASLPEGDWKLFSYTIDRTGLAPVKTTEAVKTGTTVWQTFATALMGSSVMGSSVTMPRQTLVSASAKRDIPAVKVVKGKTVDFPFGPPYKPVVTVSSRGSSGSVSLGLSLVGSGGEICTGLSVNGGRPSAPEFTITDPAGKQVVQGKFKYG